MSTLKSVFKPRMGRQTESLTRWEPRRLQPGVPGARTLDSNENAPLRKAMNTSDDSMDKEDSKERDK